MRLFVNCPHLANRPPAKTPLETNEPPLKALAFDHKQFQRPADALAVALAASLPWSTSATGILAILWLLAFVPTIDLPTLRRVSATPAGLLPLLLFALGAAGMFWADVPWAERFNGISSFLKLLFIPLLLCQFSRSDKAHHVLVGFLASCVLLLIYSWTLFFWPALPAPGHAKALGIPVKDYIAQGAMFTICIFLIARFAFDYWRAGRFYLTFILTTLALIFLTNVFYIATSRTSLVVIIVLLVVFGYKQFGWKGAIGLLAGFLVVTAIAWPTASYLRLRVSTFYHELQSYRVAGDRTSAGERVEFWTKSVGFIKAAPVVGHGTGTIKEQFRRSAVGQTGLAAEASTNPHNQILAVGIQLGLVGVALLFAMWIAHLVLFQSANLAAWVGLVVVIQNVVGSLFNSHLFDFTHGWAYVVGVGIAGGVTLLEPCRGNKLE